MLGSHANYPDSINYNKYCVCQETEVYMQVFTSVLLLYDCCRILSHLGTIRCLDGC